MSEYEVTIQPIVVMSMHGSPIFEWEYRVIGPDKTYSASAPTQRAAKRGAKRTVKRDKRRREHLSQPIETLSL